MIGRDPSSAAQREEVMKSGIWGALFGATAAIWSLPAAAQQAGEPSSVELVVPNSPGGAADTIARVIQRGLVEEKAVTAPSVVLNKPGGGGNVTLAYVEQKAGNGGVLAVTSITHQLNYIVGTSDYRYSDFTPIAMLVGDYVGFAVKADSPFKTAQDLVDALKKDPQSVSIAITGIGGLNHIPALQLARSLGIDGRKLKTPVFDSTGDSATALMGGHVDVVVGSAGNLAGHAESGQIRILAVSSPERLPGKLADIPTWKELGQDVIFSSWRGLWGPKDMTPEQIAFWDKAVAQATKSAEWKAELEKNVWTDNVMTAAETRAELDSLQKELVSLLTDLGLAKKTD
jgi:putative tricarboxylic transport membrane protein